MRNNIKRFRQERGLLQRELASIIGVSKEAISDWEVGDRNPSRDQQKAVSVALKVPLNRLFPDYSPEEPEKTVIGGNGKFAKRVEVSTMNGLRQSARIRMGEKMIVRLNVGQACGSGTDDGNVRFLRGKVVQIAPNWFRVQTDKGWSTCVHYQAFLTESTVRRAKK